MITAFVMSVLGLPKRLWQLLVKTTKKVRDTLKYLFVPPKKKGNKRK